jgi:hypothetical protein
MTYLSSGYQCDLMIEDEAVKFNPIPIHFLSEQITPEQLVAKVPELVKSAFQEGFSAEGLLGDAWDRSRARLAIDYGVQPRPLVWNEERERIELLEAKLKVAKEPITILCNAIEEKIHEMESLPIRIHSSFIFTSLRNTLKEIAE